MCVVLKPDNCINGVSLSGSLHNSGLREAEGCWCHSATDREGCCWIQQTSPPGYQSGRSLPLHLLTTLHLTYCTNQDTHLNAFIVVSLFHLYSRKQQTTKTSQCYICRFQPLFTHLLQKINTENKSSFLHFCLSKKHHKCFSSNNKI